VLTDLKIHINDGDCRVASAPETCKVADLLGDMLGKRQESLTNGRHWTLARGSGELLHADLTLAENHVESGQDLYLIAANHAPAHDLELEVIAPGGQVMRSSEFPSSFKAGELAEQAVEFFHLNEMGNDLQPKRWILIDAKQKQALNPDLSLAENGVISGQRLLLGTDRTRLLIFSPDGMVHQSDPAPVTLLGQVLTDAITSFRLPHIHRTGAPIKWHLTLKGSGGRLDPTLTVAQSGLMSGDQLLLEPEKEKPQVREEPQRREDPMVAQLPPLLLSLRLPSGAIKGFRAFPYSIVGEILSHAVGKFALATESDGGEPVRWQMLEAESGRVLDGTKSLWENNILDGGKLAIRGQSDRVALQVMAPDQQAIPVRHRREANLGLVLTDALERLGLPRFENGERIPWKIRPKGSPDLLEEQKTVGELGLTDGDVLVLVRRKESGKAFQELWRKYKVGMLVGSGLVVAAIIIVVANLHREPPPHVDVVVTPVDKAVSPGETTQFQARSSSGKVESVIWSIHPSFGTISNDGVYVAPLPPLAATQRVTVIATSTVDRTKSAQATVVVQGAIRLDPPLATLKASEKTTFTAKLRPDLGNEVTWKLDPDVGTIGDNGTYTAPQTVGSPQVVTVTVTSKQAPQYSAHATISLLARWRITPSVADLAGSDAMKFSISPDPGGPVRWTIRPALGTISATGVYTAPKVIPGIAKVWVSAEPASSPGDAAAANLPSAVASITLEPLSVSGVTCNPIDRWRYSCGATVSNAKNTGVTWSVSPSNLGDITPNGVYSAPTRSSVKSVSIVATSVADPTKKSQYTLNLPAIPDISVTVSAPRLFLSANENEQLSAAVSGTANQNVAWFLSGPGQLRSNGQYEAPKEIKEVTKVRVIAKSEEDPSKQGQVEITLQPYTGPKSGVITWRGQLKKNQILALNTAAPSLLTSGALPGVPVMIRMITPNCAVISPPSEQNNWKVIIIKTSANQKSIVFAWQVP